MIEFFQRAKAQCDDLTRVAALSLTVDTTHMSASAVGQLVPFLRSLSLRGRVPTIRDLGTHFALLTTLHLPSCNLADLDGIHAFPALIDLNVAHNRITDVSPLSLAESLVVLDVGHNKLADWTQIEELALLATLRDLTVAGNPVVAATAAPRDRVLAILPHLRSLDGVAVTLTAIYGGEAPAAPRESNGIGAAGDAVTEAAPAPSPTAEIQRLALDRLLHAIAAPVSPTMAVAPVSVAAVAVRSTTAPTAPTAAAAPVPLVGAPAERSSTISIPLATAAAPAPAAAAPVARSLSPPSPPIRASRSVSPPLPPPSGPAAPVRPAAAVPAPVAAHRRTRSPSLPLPASPAPLPPAHDPAAETDDDRAARHWLLSLEVHGHPPPPLPPPLSTGLAARRSPRRPASSISSRTTLPPLAARPDSPVVAVAMADSPRSASPVSPHVLGARTTSPTGAAGMTRIARPGPSPPLPAPPPADAHAHVHGRRRHSVQVVAAAGVTELDPAYGRTRRVSLPPPVDGQGAAGAWHGGQGSLVQAPRTASPPADDGVSDRDRGLGTVRPGVLFTA